MRHVAILAVLVATFAIGLACSGLPKGDERPPPAPDFNYITDEQLESAMWQLAAGITSLQAILSRPGPITRNQRLEVIRILDDMIAAANDLGPDGVSTNHPRITRNLGRFREMLAIARSSAQMDPPRYYLVGNISGTCLACHVSN